MSSNKRPQFEEDFRIEEIGIRRISFKYCKSNNPDIVKQYLQQKSEEFDINCHLPPFKERMLTSLMFGCIHSYADQVGEGSVVVDPDQSSLLTCPTKEDLDMEIDNLMKQRYTEKGGRPGAEKYFTWKEN